MAAIERLTITLPSDMAAVMKGAVEIGDYVSNSEVVREALRDWKMKRGATAGDGVAQSRYEQGFDRSGRGPRSEF